MEEVAKSPQPALYAALSEFQKELTIIEKTADVNAGSYSFKYAPLDEIMKTVYPLLGKNGLAVRHELNEGGIEAVLTHKDGGEIRSGAIQINRTGKMQDIGGAMTYARRYTVTMLLGIASEEDKDARDLTVEGQKQTAKDAAQNIDVSAQIKALEGCTTLEGLRKVWVSFTPAERENVELANKKDEIKSMIESDIEEPTIQMEPEPEPAIEPETEAVEPEEKPKKKAK